MSFVGLFFTHLLYHRFSSDHTGRRSVIHNSETHQNIAHGVHYKWTVVLKYLHTSGTLYGAFEKYQKSQIQPKIWKYARKFRVENLINTICSSGHKYEIVNVKEKKTRPLNKNSLFFKVKTLHKKNHHFLFGIQLIFAHK